LRRTDGERARLSLCCEEASCASCASVGHRRRRHAGYEDEARRIRGTTTVRHIAYISPLHSHTEAFERRTDSQAPKQRSALHDVVTREYTIHMHKRTHDLGFKKSASDRGSGEMTSGR